MAVPPEVAGQASESSGNGGGANAHISTTAGLTTVTFSNSPSQTIEISNVKTLVFTDHTVHLP